jgi:hypothetical protein
MPALDLSRQELLQERLPACPDLWNLNGMPANIVKHNISQLIAYVARLRAFYPSSHYALLALFFFAGLELSFALRRFVFLLIAVIVVITVIGIILIRTEERGWFHPTQAILPTLAVFGMAAFSLFLPTNLWIHVHFAVAAVVFYYILKHGARQAYPTWNWVLSLFVLFVVLASVLGWRFHLYVPVIVILPIVFVALVLISVQGLLRYTSSVGDAWLLALSIGFALSQAVWVLQFLPLHFIVQTGIMVALYYIIFQLTTSSFERRLVRQDFLEYISVGVIALIVLLLTARWA